MFTMEKFSSLSGISASRLEHKVLLKDMEYQQWRFAAPYFS